MAITETFQFDTSEKSTAFDRRAAKAGRGITRAALQRESERQSKQTEVLAKMWDKVDLLDTSKEGSGATQVTTLIFESIEASGKNPGIYIKPADSTEAIRQKDEVAFGNNDMSDRNILRVVDGKRLGQQDVKELQSAFENGVTILGDEGNFDIPNAEYDNLLGPNDAVVILHQAEPQPQLHPEDSLQA